MGSLKIFYFLYCFDTFFKNKHHRHSIMRMNISIFARKYDKFEACRCSKNNSKKLINNAFHYCISVTERMMYTHNFGDKKKPMKYYYFLSFFLKVCPCV